MQQSYSKKIFTIVKTSFYACLCATYGYASALYAAAPSIAAHNAQFSQQAQASGLTRCTLASAWPTRLGNVNRYTCQPIKFNGASWYDAYVTNGKIMFIAHGTDVTETLPESGPSDYMLINTTPDKSNYDCPSMVYFIDLTGKQPIAYRFGIRHACSTVADEAFYDPDGRPSPTNAEIAAGYRRPKLTVEQNRKYNGDVQWGKKTIILTMAGGFPFVYDRATHKFASLPTLTKTHGATLAFSTDINGNLLTDAQIDKIAPSVKPFADQVYPKPATSAPPTKP